MRLAELPLYDGAIVKDRDRLGWITGDDGNGEYYVDGMNTRSRETFSTPVVDMDGEDWTILEPIETDPNIRLVEDKALSDARLMAKHICPIDFLKMRDLVNNRYVASKEKGGMDLILSTLCSIACDIALCEYVRSGYAVSVGPQIHFVKQHLITCTREHS